MNKSGNVRVENKIKINIGSLNLKKGLFLKAQQYIGDRSYQEMNQIVKEILKKGVYEKKSLENGRVVHLFHRENIFIELNTTATNISNIYKMDRKEKVQPIAKGNAQKGKNLKLVKDDVYLANKEWEIEESFIESSLNILHNKLLDIENYGRQMNQSLSRTDKEISKIYHDLETTNFNASQGYFFAKRLQTLLRRRRFIKTEIDKLKSTNKEFQQIKELIHQSEQKMMSKQNRYEVYSEGWNISLNEWGE